MLELIVLGFVFWLGYQLGYSVFAFRMRDIILRAAKSQGIVIDEEKISFKPVVYELVVEELQNTLYLYDKKENTFVCQAANLDDLAQLAKKHSNIEYAAVLYGDKVYKFVDGKVQTNES